MWYSAYAELVIVRAECWLTAASLAWSFMLCNCSFESLFSSAALATAAPTCAREAMAREKKEQE
jgi:hypothetical protein